MLRCSSFACLDMVRCVALPPCPLAPSSLSSEHIPVVTPPPLCRHPPNLFTGLVKTLSLDFAADGCLDVTSSENNEIGYTFLRSADEPPPDDPSAKHPRRPAASLADTVGFEGLMLVKKPRGKPVVRWCVVLFAPLRRAACCVRGAALRRAQAAPH